MECKPCKYDVRSCIVGYKSNNDAKDHPMGTKRNKAERTLRRFHWEKKEWDGLERRQFFDEDVGNMEGGGLAKGSRLEKSGRKSEKWGDLPSKRRTPKAPGQLKPLMYLPFLAAKASNTTDFRQSSTASTALVYNCVSPIHLVFR